MGRDKELADKYMKLIIEGKYDDETFMRELAERFPKKLAKFGSPLSEGQQIDEEPARTNKIDMMAETASGWVNNQKADLKQEYLRMHARKYRIQTAEFVWLDGKAFFPAIRGQDRVKAYPCYNWNDRAEVESWSRGQFDDLELINNHVYNFWTWGDIFFWIAGHTLWTHKIRLRGYHQVSGCVSIDRCLHNPPPCHDEQIFLLWSKIQQAKADIKKIKADQWRYRRLFDIRWPKEIYPEIWLKKQEIKQMKAERKARIAKVKEELKKWKENFLVQRDREIEEYNSPEQREWRKVLKARRKTLLEEERKKVGAQDLSDIIAGKDPTVTSRAFATIEDDDTRYDLYPDTLIRKQRHVRDARLYGNRPGDGLGRLVDPYLLSEILYKECRGESYRLLNILFRFSNINRGRGPWKEVKRLERAAIKRPIIVRPVRDEFDNIIEGREEYREIDPTDWIWEPIGGSWWNRCLPLVLEPINHLLARVPGYKHRWRKPLIFLHHNMNPLDRFIDWMERRVL